MSGLLRASYSGGLITHTAVHSQNELHMDEEIQGGWRRKMRREMRNRDVDCGFVQTGKEGEAECFYVCVCVSVCVRQRINQRARTDQGRKRWPIQGGMIQPDDQNRAIIASKLDKEGHHFCCHLSGGSITQHLNFIWSEPTHSLIHSLTIIWKWSKPVMCRVWHDLN